MGIAHRTPRQQSFVFTSTKSDHRFSHGGTLFQKRQGRGQRPLSTREPLHLVFKVRPERLRTGSLREPHNFRLIHEILRRYSKKFFVKIDQVSIQRDHIHILLRTSRRSFFHFFFRVVAGQIAQRFEKEGYLKEYRVVRSGDRKPSRSDYWSEMQHQGKLHQEKLRSERPVQDKLGSKMGSHEKLSSERVSGTPARPGTGLWRYRPFSRVVKGWRAYGIVRDYIQLNEQEVLGLIPYRPERLRGLSSSDWEILWRM